MGGRRTFTYRHSLGGLSGDLSTAMLNQTEPSVPSYDTMAH